MGAHPKKFNKASWQWLAKTIVGYLLLKFTVAEEFSLLDPDFGSATVSDFMIEKYSDGSLTYDPMNLIDLNFDFETQEL